MEARAVNDRMGETMIWIEDIDPPYVRLTWSYFPHQNSTRIKRRVDRLAVKYSTGWHCVECGDLMPVYRLLDAVYCSEICRKITARKRRNARSGAT